MGCLLLGILAKDLACTRVVTFKPKPAVHIFTASYVVTVFKTELCLTAVQLKALIFLYFPGPFEKLNKILLVNVSVSHLAPPPSKHLVCD